MKKITKKLSLLLLSLAAFAVVSGVTGVTAQAEPVADEKVVVYLDGQKNVALPANIYISDLSESDVIHKDSVTSSNPGVATISYLNMNTSKDTNTYFSDLPEETYGYTNARIELIVRKTGTSVISFKINDKTYKTTVKAYKYTNPIKTLKITGIKNGKNQASKFKNKAMTNVTLKKKINNPVLSVTAKKNWKILDIMISESNSKSGIPVGHTMSSYFNGKTKANLRLDTLKAKNSYDIMITMQNKKTQGIISCNYRINMK